MNNNNNSLITFSQNFLKSITLRGFTCNSAVETLTQYANRNNFDVDETIYYFVVKLFSDDLFFTLDESEAKEILYLAIFWASYVSIKSGTRKALAKKVTLNPRDHNKYIALQSKVVHSIHKNFSGLDALDRLEVYLLIFFELNCVKRKKKQVK